MRAFFAVFFDRDVTESLDRNQNKCREIGIKGKYVDPKNIHLTVKFLGELEAHDIDKLEPLAAEVTGFGPLTLQLGDLGVFPPKGRPKVLWQGLAGDDIDQLTRMQRIVEEFCVQTLDVEWEKRKFHPHVTIARNPQIPREISIKRSEEIGLEKPLCRVDYLSLMKSELTPRGPVYKALKHFQL